MRSSRLLASAGAMLVFAGLYGKPEEARAWGDEGHMIVALVAEQFLDPTVKNRVDAMLDADEDDLTPSDLASRATWADRYRDSDRHTTKIRYNATHLWHFVDIELIHPNIDQACHNHPPLPANAPASKGPANSCVVDKIEQFSAELRDPGTSDAERLLALKFLLHFVGDVHQPLHAADNMDEGGNKVPVLFGRLVVAGNLHSYWDTTLVQRLGRDPRKVANDLVQEFKGKEGLWMAGKAADWAQESFTTARDVAYKLPQPPVPDERGSPAYRIDQEYEKQALGAVREQLAKAGMRLAMVLNQALKP